MSAESPRIRANFHCIAVGTSQSGKAALLPQMIHSQPGTVVWTMRCNWSCVPSLASVCERAGYLKLL